MIENLCFQPFNTIKTEYNGLQESGKVGHARQFQIFPSFFCCVIFVLHFFLITEVMFIHEAGKCHTLTHPRRFYDLNPWCGTFQISLYTHTRMSCQPGLQMNSLMLDIYKIPNFLLLQN